jgi:demethylmenaquinone methyltransferase/2-methoxy-6-polyprenyl-1,4-benzoquinol methylase
MPLATGALPDGAAPTPGAPETQAVRSMFDRIAPRYDLLNRVLSAGTDVRWRRRAVDFLGLSAPFRVLDLCSGTADLLIEALGRGAGMRGVGVDLSLPMLQRGRSKLRARGLLERGPLASGDAEELPLRASCVDGALVAFGIRNVGRPLRALQELRRVLRPGGRLVILEFSMPRGALGGLYRFYFRRVLPFVGGLVSGDPGAYRYLPASVERFAGPGELAGLLEEAGFTSIAQRPLSAGIAYLHRGERPREGAPQR